MGRIPEETIQRVLAATDIVELIGRSVKLRRAGSNWSGLCPFHTERSPSFTVYPHNHSYHCFGCKASGTAVRFLMEHEGLSFVESVKRLAEVAGIPVEEEMLDPEAERAAKHRAVMRTAHEQLAQWFHRLLLRDRSAAPARDYLKSRGISSDVAKTWLLGYAPPSSILHRRWAAAHGYSDGFLVEAGIYKQGDDGAYPGFRHRLMFPIRTDVGDIVAFSGRQLDPEAKGGKYINSPETPIFSKGRVFFGFDKSKVHIKRTGQAVVCEGQIDLITAFEFGVKNIVAPLGTAFGEQHAKMLKAQADEAILCFDADTAGIKATTRVHEMLSNAGLVVRVAALPKGEDPDSLIRKQGIEAFQKLLNDAQDYLDFQINYKKSTHGTDLRSQMMIVEQTAATIAMNPSAAARDLMVRGHAAQLNLTEDALRKVVNTYVRRQKRQNENQEASAARRAPPAEMSPAQAAENLIKSQQKTALLLAHQALMMPEVMDWLRKQDLDPILQDLPGTEMLGLVWQTHFDPSDVAARTAFIAGLPAVEESAFTQILNRSMPGGDLKNVEQDLESLFSARLKSLIQRTEIQLRRPDLSVEQIGEFGASLAQWRKELLDRTRQG